MPGKSRDVHRRTPGPGLGRAGLTLQLDGLTGRRAVVTLVEASRLIGGLYLLGGPHHHPAGRVGDRSPQEPEETDPWGEEEAREEVLPLETGGSTKRKGKLSTSQRGKDTKQTGHLKTAPFALRVAPRGGGCSARSWASLSQEPAARILLADVGDGHRIYLV